MPNRARTAPAASTTSRLLAAALCLAVSWIHVQDQGGFPGDKTPHYVGVGYYLLEAAGVLAALLLLAAGGRVAGWLLAAGVAFGPLLGFVLSRGPGLPGYGDDRGNWTEPLGIAGVAVEAVLLALAVTAFLTASQTGRRVAT
ncbi:hypothetical protein GCM10009665_08700 [Kitasatospora nipponensis]|uniref:Uncharacterized protein n=1 Tax=Kitasatospora nipponensis TaxID=258049 RepID=A0ABN1VS60_9ACTN